jgi:membrane-associated PAP2 superfamily phosphatase
LIHERHAAEIRDTFAEHELAVSVKIITNFVAAELALDATGARFKVLAVLRRPPVAQVSLAIELAAMVVKAVKQLVADDCADAAVVDRRVGIRIEEGRL